MKKRSASLLLVLLAATLSSLAAAPKYIFYFIGDGMGVAPTMGAVAYNRAMGVDSLPLMMTFPSVGQLMTYSADSPVTDSAAAGTALATGHKTRNGMLGVTPDTASVESVAAILHRQGYGVGIVTTVAADDATPGAFYAHVPHRSMRADVDRQFVESGFEFLGGAALCGLVDADGRPNDVAKLYADNGVAIYYGMDSYRRSRAEQRNRVVLLSEQPFQQGNAGYVIDSVAGAIPLVETTTACLEHLERVSPDRFFMMVEGGSIDHALHGNDAATAFAEIYDFNRALRLAYDFMLRHPDETLIVVTADHDTGGFSIGNEANGYTARFERLRSQKVSKEMFSDRCKQLLATRPDVEWAEMEQTLADQFGFWSTIELDEAETADLRDRFDRVFRQKEAEGSKGLYNNFNYFAERVFELVSKKAAVGWTTSAHTGNPVPIYAVGVGSERFGRFLNNTQVAPLILEIAECD